MARSATPTLLEGCLSEVFRLGLRRCQRELSRILRQIIALDGLGLAEEYMAQHAEEILELFDWTGPEVEFHPITLDHFKGLLMGSLSPAVVGGASE